MAHAATPTAHLDTFARDRLPAPDAQPEFLFELPELQFPARLQSRKWTPGPIFPARRIIGHTQWHRVAEPALRIKDPDREHIAKLGGF